MPGPPRTPTALALLQGDPGHRAKTRAAREPKPPVSTTIPPDWIRQDPLARGIWRTEAPRQIALTVLTTSDRLLFAALCERAATYRQAAEAIRRQGLTHLTAQGEIPRPEVAIARAALRDLVLLARDFGMTPAARSRLSIEAPHDDGDELATFRKAHPRRRA